MGLVRGIVGFLTFLLLFDLRDDPTWQMALVLVLTGGGALVGSVVAPALRRGFVEERMLMLALVGRRSPAALTAAWIGDLAGSVLLAAIVAIVSTSGKLAFDSLVQRDAPDANRGRSFARFELRFQIVWVVGAVIPVLVTIPLTVGLPRHRRRRRLRALHLPRRPASHRPRGAARRPAPADPTTVIDPTLIDHTAIRTMRPRASARAERSRRPSPGR